MSNLFLGMDCSTQSLTVIIIDSESKKILYRNSIQYGKDLIFYRTKDGIILDKDDQKVHSNPLMWLEALEILFQEIVQSEVDVNDIKAISGSGQQHGTVYLNSSFNSKIENLDPSKKLTSQLKGSFSRQTSPIWMDSSTTRQCEEIREQLGGKEEVIRLTGSDTFERFSGPQIRKFYQEQPEAYKNTDKIHLVSSFMASLLLGDHAPIDYGDGAGMNLMDIEKREWSKEALEVTAPNLQEKLPLLVPSYEIIGTLSKYFVERYRLLSTTKLVAWSGDNPNSLIGIGLIQKGQFALSLGTSDTYFGYLKDLQIDLKGEGHIFGAPTGDYMSLICYKNASLAREKIRAQFKLKWEDFSNILRSTPPGNFGKIMLPYFFPEIVPLVLEPRVYRFGFDESDLEGNIRAIIEAQFLSMRLHSDWITETPKEIFATGGASINREILQVAADVFDAPIYRFEITDSAALGAAFRAAYSYYNQQNFEMEWMKLIEDFLESQIIETIKPNPDNKELYDDMVELYKKCEDFAIRGANNPEQDRQEFIHKYFAL
jgi:xylulokinase